MTRAIKHLSLQRIGRTELRVVADVESGVLPLVQVEEAVIRGYAHHRRWPHRWVTLFVLENLSPLVRQLQPGVDLPQVQWADLEQRPVVNVYDLADPTACHVFVNQQVMMRVGYWGDTHAVRGLLAHEHAHPLAENETVRSSRGWQIEMGWEHEESPPPRSGALFSTTPPEAGRAEGSRRRFGRGGDEQVRRVLTALTNKLCLHAPREIFANELTIRSGFGDALLYLDQRNVENARQSLSGRVELVRQLQGEVAQGQLDPRIANGLLLIGDMQGYLDLALEVSPFYRAGQTAEAKALEAVLESDVFPHVAAEVSCVYAVLREHYVALRSDLSVAEFAPWGESVLGILAEALSQKGIVLSAQLSRESND